MAQRMKQNEPRRHEDTEKVGEMLECLVRSLPLWLVHLLCSAHRGQPCESSRAKVRGHSTCSLWAPTDLLPRRATSLVLVAPSRCGPSSLEECNIGSWCPTAKHADWPSLRMRDCSWWPSRKR